MQFGQLKGNLENKKNKEIGKTFTTNCKEWWKKFVPKTITISQSLHFMWNKKEFFLFTDFPFFTAFDSISLTIDERITKQNQSESLELLSSPLIFLFFILLLAFRSIANVEFRYIIDKNYCLTSCLNFHFVLQLFGNSLMFKQKYVWLRNEQNRTKNSERKKVANVTCSLFESCSSFVLYNCKTLITFNVKPIPSIIQMYFLGDGICETKWKSQRIEAIIFCFFPLIFLFQKNKKNGKNRLVHFQQLALGKWSVSTTNENGISRSRSQFRVYV